jgi:hypothetical protein
MKMKTETHLNERLATVVDLANKRPFARVNAVVPQEVTLPYELLVAPRQRTRVRVVFVSRKAFRRLPRRRTSVRRFEVGSAGRRSVRVARRRSLVIDDGGVVARSAGGTRSDFAILAGFRLFALRGGNGRRGESAVDGEGGLRAGAGGRGGVAVVVSVDREVFAVYG